jgi:hypothetical protein
MFYIGKHYGLPNDGYICSSKPMLRDYKKNPEHFKRRILQYVNEIDGSQSLDAETKWLALIPDEQLGKKYYNLKKETFGHNRGHKKSRVWNSGLSKEQQREYQELRKNKLFCLLTEKPKRGIIFKPIIEYTCGFCKKIFDSKINRKFCSKSCSAKWANANGGAERSSKANKGRLAWNKGLPNATAAANGKKSAAKQSATVTGRKLFIREDGSRTWIYPNKNLGTQQAT